VQVCGLKLVLIDPTLGLHLPLLKLVVANLATMLCYMPDTEVGYQYYLIDVYLGTAKAYASERLFNQSWTRKSTRHDRNSSCTTEIAARRLDASRT
jgi:hypothetical protein